MTAAVPVPHPYYPLDSELLRYVANDWNAGGVFVVFFAAVSMVVATARMIAKAVKPSLKGRDLTLVVWFMLCKSIRLCNRVALTITLRSRIGKGGLGVEKDMKHFELCGVWLTLSVQLSRNHSRHR